MDFREILGVSKKRRLELLEILYYHRKGYSQDHLLSELNCSLPILKNDIKIINSKNTYFQIVKKEGWYSLSLDRSVSLSNLYSDILRFIPEYQIIEELLYEECNNITALSEKLQLSTSNTQRCIKKIEKTLESSKMKLCFRPLRIEGSESEIRHFYFRFYMERQSTIENLLPKLTVQQYLTIEKYVEDFAVANDIWRKYVFEKRLNYNFYISLWRIKNNHAYPKHELRKLGLNLPQKESYKQLEKVVWEIVGIRLSRDILRDCLWLSFSDAVVFSINHREYALIDNPRYQYLYMLHYDLVREFDELLGCRLSKKDKINFATVLCNDVYLYDTDSTFLNLLWDNRVFFLKESIRIYSNGIKRIRQLVESFVTRNEIYQEEGFIQNYVYLLLTTKVESLKWLAKQDHLMKVLLLSDLTPTEETFLAHQIQENVFGNFIIDHFEKLPGGTDQLTNEIKKYDCLVTTRLMTGIPEECPVLVIEPFLTSDNIQDIQKLVTCIAEKRNEPYFL